ncbi:uncharacterized protein LOC131680410 [Topomyia yanbarensis]|uniref:uncharacterized protein LOC131680410 n=1 Tax=Topomyia yanbarensis TaxID=2498891 RepID=UPI00273BBA9E|nr:uncharacterized protein LOC131680410 [Topomyia yanbarensis]
MPRVRPTTKLGVYGQCDLNPEKAVILVSKSKLQNKYYIKTPNSDVARLSFEIKGIQGNRVYEEVTREQQHLRALSHKQFRMNENRLSEADKLLQTLWVDFVEVNNFLKDCEAKENESYETMETEKRRQIVFHEKIEHMELDLIILKDFGQMYEQTIKDYAPYESVLKKTIKVSETFDTTDDLMKRCDSLRKLLLLFIKALT